MEEEISRKNQNIKNLEDKYSKEFKLTKFWMEKFSEAITKSSEAQYYSLEDTSFNTLCQSTPPELNIDTTEPAILKGDICSINPRRTRDGTESPVTTTHPHESLQTRESLSEKKTGKEVTSEEKSYKEEKGQENVGGKGRKGRNKRKKK